MVVFHLKVRGESDQFLYETSIGESNDKVIRELCQICGLREKLGRLAGMLEELSRYGPSKAESERGLDEIQEQEGRTIVKGPHYTADPLGNRTGNAPPPQLVGVLEKVAQDGVDACSKNLVSQGVVVTVRGLQEKVDNIRGAVTMAYPMGLPEWDPVRLMVEDGGGGRVPGRGERQGLPGP